MTPKLIIHQKITAFVNKYTVYGAQSDGSEGQPQFFVQQKRVALKEKVSFYADESKNNLAFTFRAEKVMDIHGKYFVEDANGVQLGGFKKQFKSSLLNSTWTIFDASGIEKFTVKESNDVLAILRRFGGMIPIVGAIVDIVCTFLRYHFVFIDVQGGQTVGTYVKTTLLRDNYTLNMTDASFASVDVRLLSAMGVALDALQSR